MTHPHPIVSYCRDKGKDVEFVPGNSGTIFDDSNGMIRHDFDYRDEVRRVIVKCEGGVKQKTFWNRLLTAIRKEKHYVDYLWEHGTSV